MTGAAVQWLRDGLGLIDSAAEIEGLARTVPDSGDVVFVPALTGMGAPHWDPHARGAILGITRGTTRAPRPRHPGGDRLRGARRRRRDGRRGRARGAGAVRRRRRQRQRPAPPAAGRPAGVPVRRPEVTETTALGAAFLAGLGTGVWVDRRARPDLGPGPRFEPEEGRRDDGRHDRWRDALPAPGSGPPDPVGPPSRWPRCSAAPPTTMIQPPSTPATLDAPPRRVPSPRAPVPPWPAALGSRHRPPPPAPACPRPSLPRRDHAPEPGTNTARPPRRGRVATRLGGGGERPSCQVGAAPCGAERVLALSSTPRPPRPDAARAGAPAGPSPPPPHAGDHGAAPRRRRRAGRTPGGGLRLHQRHARLDRGVGPQRPRQLLAGLGEGGQGPRCRGPCRCRSRWGGAGHGSPAVGHLQPQRVAEPLEPGLGRAVALMPGSTVNAAAELISRTWPLRFATAGSAACV